MKKDPLVFIDHILESIGLIEDYLKNETEEGFYRSKKQQDAVIRRIEIIGEAVKNLPAEFKDKYPKVPWKRIAGMRDVLAHGYFGVDLKLTWKVARNDIPQLKEWMADIKADLDKQ